MNTFNYNYNSRNYQKLEIEKNIDFIFCWNKISENLNRFIIEKKYKTGRKPYDLKIILIVNLIKIFFKINSVKETLMFIKINRELRNKFNLNKIPSSSTISRRTNELIELNIIEKIFNEITRIYFEDKLIINTSIDSTIIENEETTKHKKIKEKKIKCKKGRKKKNSQDEKDFIKKLKQKERYKNFLINGNIMNYLKSINNNCSSTAKKDSKGKISWKKGFKAHIICDDYSIPIAFLITGASVYDSKVAIPLIRRADEKSKFLYVLCDGGYSNNLIYEAADNLGKVAIIDFKANRNNVKPQMEDFEKERYKNRSNIERLNGELKNCFLPNRLKSRGNKAILDIQIALLFLTIKRIEIVKMSK